MAKGKYAGKHSLNVKVLAMMLAVSLLVGTAIGGTLAWLTDTSKEVKNTFTVGNIDIELEETERTYKMIPGDELPKDPKVTVAAGSEDSWVFVKVTKSSNFDDYMTCPIDSGWKKLADDKDNNALTDVYYRAYAGDDAAAYPVLTGNKVLVKNTVTKQMMDALDGIDSNGKTDTEAAKAEVNARPTLTFIAYAIQKANVGDDSTKTDAENAAAAWNAILNPPT